MTLRFTELFSTGARHWLSSAMPLVLASLTVATPLATHAAPSVETVTVVEYYNATLNAYFMTARAAELALLDATPGFSQTGARFVANAAVDATPGQTRICRFYVSSDSPFTSSHFYGAERTDCSALIAARLAGFNFEGYDFAVALPDVAGTCPANAKLPVYRAFRKAANSKTANHRYSASLIEYNAMIARGWSGEGVAYCTPAAQYPVPESARVAAVRQVAAENASCTAVAPFYFEIGDKQGARVSGSVGTGVGAATLMSIASASKWIYGAYVTQMRGGLLSVDDVRFLTFTSGYVTFAACAQTDTVRSCALSGSNGVFTPAAVGKFSYAGSHMQSHANNFTALGALSNAGLASAILSGLRMPANAIDFHYSQPQLAGGAYTSANTYTAFLRKLLDQSLVAGTQLNSHAVCTNSQTCANALYSPFAATESPTYSIGHWVEDPLVSDGAYSSGGALGFYPWIEPTQAHYGVLARQDFGLRSGAESVPCGRKLRQAWATGVATP